MKLLFCEIDSKDDAVSHLESILESIAGEQNVVTCRTLQEFQQRLRSLWRGYDIVLLNARNASELKAYVGLHDLLEDFPVILVLPDNDIDTLRSAHLLRPRFITYKESDFSDIRSVLEKVKKKLLVRQCCSNYS